MKSEMIHAIAEEIRLQKDFIADNEFIETIYLGGGTPSLLNHTELEILLHAIDQRFQIIEQPEITLEANPDDVNETNIDIWKSLGINRLSLGIQSFIENELQWMNRAHDSRQAIESIQLLQKMGLDNISTDLIFGGPLMSDEDLRKHLNILISYQIPHVSAYALTVENKTLLHHQIKNKQLTDLDAEKQSRQFLIISDLLGASGYEHYEISNYALSGKRSKHNSSYWQGKPYFGFGPAAHGYNGTDTRRWNIANNAIYLNSISKSTIPFEEEVLTADQQVNEYIMTSLRTMEGMDMLTIKNLLDSEKWTALKKKINPYLMQGHLIAVEDKIQLSRTGKLFADGIAADLFF